MWSAEELAPGTCRRFTFGPLCVWIRRTRSTWQYACEDGCETEATASQNEPPDGLEWTAFVAATVDETVVFQPAPPDRPVVVHTEQPFELAPGAGYTLYTGIPLWVRARLGGRNGQLLFDIPTRTLSNTWFGGAMTGKLCYTSPNLFARDTKAIPEGGGYALCPLHVRNSSDHPFVFSKIAILADLLSVYRSTESSIQAPPPRSRWWTRGGTRATLVQAVPGQLWTSEAYAHYSAEQELNVSVADHAPRGEHVFEMLCEPRGRDSDNILKRSMILLRRISNYE